MDLPAGTLQHQERSGHDEFDVVGVRRDRECARRGGGAVRTRG